MDFVVGGGVESGTIVSSGGETFDYGSTVSGTVASGGALYLFGSASGTTVQAGGGLFISSGGVASSGTVLGRQEALSGGLEQGTMVGNGGINIVSSGGTASGTTVLSGGADFLVGGGVESATTVSSGGQAFVWGSATGTLVTSGGADYVQSGGTLNGATLSGGLIEIRSGGTAGANSITFTSAGGALQLDDSQHFNGVISGFGIPGDIDLTDINFATATLGYSGNTTSGVLTVGDGTHTATIHLLGQYVQGNFHLSDDGFGKVLVTDPPVAEVAGNPYLAPNHG
jgi:autotransporter passenger strand-loop-strand repeat protein